MHPTTKGQTYIHDMNIEIPSSLDEQFTTVLDGGTLEHIFSFPTAIRNCMRMVVPGGHLLVTSPANNQAGHGFYQFSPELDFRLFSPAFGFQVEEMLISEPIRRKPRWYQVLDPAAVGRRCQFSSRQAAYLFVRAQRVGPVPAFDLAPQQSDYTTAWAASRVVSPDALSRLPGRDLRDPRWRAMLNWSRTHTPKFVKQVKRRTIPLTRLAPGE